MSGVDWVSGSEAQPEWVSLKPADMPSLSSGGTQGALTSAPVMNKTQIQKPNNIISSLSKDEAKEVGKDLTKAVSEILETNEILEQDNMEGVEDKDWDEDN